LRAPNRTLRRSCPYAGEEISLFIEVKGIWHDKIKTEIEHQLADRYLTGARSLTGIYLVAAFASEHWASGDTRRSEAHARPERIEAIPRRRSRAGCRLEPMERSGCPAVAPPTLRDLDQPVDAARVRALAGGAVMRCR